MQCCWFNEPLPLASFIFNKDCGSLGEVFGDIKQANEIYYLDQFYINE